MMRPFKNLQLSPLMLGTAQFGLPYGVANKSGQPSPREVLEILACAREGGINCLDTAATYGESEAVIGRALRELKIAAEMIVVSKVCFMADGLSVSKADEVVEESVTRSLRLLQLDTLPICLFHHEQNACYMDSLLKLQARGMVGHVGSSVMTPGITSALLEDEAIEALQIPISLFDHRFRASGVLQAARGRAVFARSVYLQGLLLMPEADIPAELSQVIPLRRELQKVASEAGLEMSALAVRYVLSLDVTCVVIGAETLGQMRANLALFEAAPLPRDLMREIEKIVPPLPDEILLPNHWSTRMPDVAPAGR